MVDMKGSKTEKNILIAFAGESQARNRYSYYAKVAKKDGYVQIAGIFERTAEQERAHAKTFLKFLEGGEVEITAKYPAIAPGSTMENLQNAAAGEEHEYETMYPEFAAIAEEEGFPVVAATMRSIAVAEKQHAKVYRTLIENIETNAVFEKNEEVNWYCSKCGFTHKGSKAPKKCPACAHSQAYFEMLAENV
ncbi:MAG: rubrerythrin family protein [Desulfocapsa sp.]|nr:rubrerythrin family protein [Desulfocapsa sp.]